MGGSAFNTIVSSAAFPRIPPKVYQSLKTRLVPVLSDLYEHVAVPHEAPEKIDHGDLDLLVACPKSPPLSRSSPFVIFPAPGSPTSASTTQSPDHGLSSLVSLSLSQPDANHLVAVPHDVVTKAINAMYVVPMEGNRTSNYAVRVEQGEWSALGFEKEEKDAREAVEDREIFYQVDVHVCTDKAEWERFRFFNSYGDLGMILGLIARNAGFLVGAKGLKLPNQPHKPVDLSQSFDEITDFLGLSMRTWEAGFRTKREVFEWAATCRFFDPARFRHQGQGITKVKVERKMYAEFVEWVGTLPLADSAAAVGDDADEKRKGGNEDENKKEINLARRKEALVRFGKQEEYEEFTKEWNMRMRLKAVFSGSNVMSWVQLNGSWKGVKLIMDEVRVRLGGDEGVLKFVEKEGEDELRSLILKVKSDLGLGSGVLRSVDNAVVEVA